MYNGVPTSWAKAVYTVRSVSRPPVALAMPKSGRARRRQAIDAYRQLVPLIRKWRGQGLSFAAVAARLNQLGHTTRTGAVWVAQQVWRVIDRAGG
jgi:hypothetical protein